MKVQFFWPSLGHAGKDCHEGMHADLEANSGGVLVWMEDFQWACPKDQCLVKLFVTLIKGSLDEKLPSYELLKMLKIQFSKVIVQ